MARTTKASEQALRETINNVDQISQDTFEAISSIAQMLLLAMKVPGSHRSNEAMARCLMQIEELAERGQNEINTAAEDVGCNYTDSDWKERLTAFSETSCRQAGVKRNVLEVAHA